MVSSKSKTPIQESDHAETSHGFWDLEDEHKERKAALSSPIKGGKRLSSTVSTHHSFQSFLTSYMQAIVKLEHTPPPPPPSKRVAAGRREKFTNANLPRGCQDGGAWRRILIPTYLQYLACRDADDDAWAINDDKGVSIQQKIWDFVYGEKVPHIITVQGPVFALVGITILLASCILITSLSRSTNVCANGVVDLRPLPSLLSMLSLMTTTTILMTAVKNLQRLLWNHTHFSTAMFLLPRLAR